MARKPSRAPTDLEVLQRSQRSKWMVLGSIGLALAGYAYLSSGGPIGKHEDASSIFVVRDGDTRYAPALRGLGFTVHEGTMAHFEGLAGEHMPDFESDDAVAKVLRLADWSGHAFVVFENPAELDLSGVDFEKPSDVAAISSYTEFAVISVGDYGQPHRLTLPPTRDDMHTGYELDLLTALFEQTPLVQVRDPDANKPHEIFELRTKLRGALERLEEIDAAKETLARIHEQTRRMLTDDERGEPPPALLGAIEESVQPIALADGSVLTAIRSVDLRSKNGLTAEPSLSSTWKFLYYPPGDTRPQDRRECKGLLGGSLEQKAGRPRIRWSVPGDALLVDDGDTPRLFTLTPDGTCTFTDRGPVAFSAGDRRNVGVVGSHGGVARTHVERGGDGVDEAVVSVLQTREGDAGPRLTELLRTSHIQFGSPVWLDARHVAVVGGSDFETQLRGLFLLSLDHPGEAVLIPAEAVDGAGSIWQVAAAPPPPAPQADAPPTEADDAIVRQLVLVAPGAVRSSRLYRLDMTRDFAGLFADAIARAPAQPAAEGTVELDSVAFVEKVDDALAQAEPADAAGDPARAVDSAPAEDDAAALEEAPRPVGFEDQPFTGLGPRVHIYWPATEKITRLHDHQGVTDPVVSPDGEQVVFQIDVGRNGYEIATLDMNGGDLRVLTDNDLDDHTPVFTADSQRVLFRTRYKLERTTWWLTAGRAVDAARR